MPSRRTAFFISDRTGITVEMLGNSLLTQFDVVEFHRVTLPFIDNMEKAQDVLNQIKAAHVESGMIWFKTSCAFSRLSIKGRVMR